jgi:hypothetical protein
MQLASLSLGTRRDRPLLRKSPALSAPPRRLRTTPPRDVPTTVYVHVRTPYTGARDESDVAREGFALGKCDSTSLATPLGTPLERQSIVECRPPLPVGSHALAKRFFCMALGPGSLDVPGLRERRCRQRCCGNRGPVDAPGAMDGWRVRRLGPTRLEEQSPLRRESVHPRGSRLHHGQMEWG